MPHAPKPAKLVTPHGPSAPSASTITNPPYVIPKMTPNITHITEPAEACVEAGADAISAINTIKSVTMDVDAEVSGMRTISGYSGRAVRPIALRHGCYRHDQTNH